MRIDTKYFIPFMAVVALVGAIIIGFFTLSNQKGRRKEFRRAIMAQDSLKYQKMPVLYSEDSLRIADFKGRYVLLDFWATWSDYSEEAHKQINQMLSKEGDSLKVVSAVVEDKRNKVQAYIQKHNYPFSWVNGTAVFNAYHVPGIPTQLLYNPEGSLVKVYFGYTDSSRYNSLKTLKGQ